MGRAFAIGDIHGCSVTFRKMVKDVIRLQKEDTLYCLGDYVDRGRDSKGVIDFILELRAQGHAVHTLRGNHEQIMIDSVLGQERFDHWSINGGDATLQSFGVDSYNELSAEYKAFFGDTEYYRTYDRYILVHAGLNFAIPDPFQDTVSMMWIRGFEVDDEFLGNRILVHGHTPIELDRIRQQPGGKVFNIDGGCVYRARAGMGNLIGLELGENRIIAVPNAD